MKKPALMMLALALVASPLAAKNDKHEKHEKAEKHEKHRGKGLEGKAAEGLHLPAPASPRVVERGGSRDEPWLRVTISEREAAVLRDYYGPAKRKSLPPGLQKKAARGNLPPGWQKKLARGEVLDADIYRHAEPLPAIVLRDLPPQPRGTILVRIDGKAVRLLEATHEILDVFDIF